MPRNEPPFLEQLTAFGDEAPSLEAKIALLRSIRSHSEELGSQADLLLLRQAAGFYKGLKEAEANQAELKELLEKLGATPWHPALFLGPVATAVGPRAMVIHGTARRVVGLAEDLSLDSLSIGDEVFLGNELNVVMAKSPLGGPRCGETACFERRTQDGRMVLEWRDETVVVDSAAALGDVEIKKGDLIRWDRNAWMALEKIEQGEERQFLLEEVPDLGRDQVGGQDENLETLLSALTTILVAPDKAKLYGLGARQSILMCGPPGCGKTLMARVAAAEIGRMSGTRCRFGVVKPAEWEDPYVGVTQQNIRRCFKALREAAEEGFAVLFLDEIEAAGRIRGSAVGHHSDKFLAALLAELDGFEDREGVAIIAASNRKDLIDPALLERLSDVEIDVGRPNMDGARSILGIHLPESLPFSPDGEASGDTRRSIIETAVSRLYSPNGENQLCTLRFRDGKTRTVTACELASGRVFAQLCREARQRAFLRHVRGAEPGICAMDMEDAVSRMMERLASRLTVRNVHAYVSDLPQDNDVVAVEPVARKVRRPHHYLNLSVA